MRKQRGFTVVEVMMAMVIFAGTMVGFAGVYAVTGRLNGSSRNLTQAMTDARVILEMIRNTAQANGLNGVTGAFPPGTPVAAPAGAAAWSLPGEVVSVSYANPPPPAIGGVTNLNADPLPVTVSVTWNERGPAAPPRTVSVSTLMTRR